MMVSNNYVSPRLDLSATFESLNDDTLTTVLEFVGNKSYRSFGGISKHCREIYLTTEGMTKKTFVYGYAPFSAIIDRYESDALFNRNNSEDRVGKGVVFYNRRDIFVWAVQQQKTKVLSSICELAGEEERFDILIEMWNNMDIKRDIFERVDGHAARGGKLNVLKWLETKGLSIHKMSCAYEAARHGQLNIIQWLKQERRLELFGRLYDFAARDGHLHVMKWLREQEVDWSDMTFVNAAEEGNLEVLQWLHDEGCPWPEDDDLRVNADGLQPEVVDWLHENGYSNRFLLRRWYSFEHFRVDIL